MFLRSELMFPSPASVENRSGGWCVAGGFEKFDHVMDEKGTCTLPMVRCVKNMFLRFI